MNKNQGRLLTTVFIIVIAFYLAYDFSLDQKRFIDFINAYLNNYQTHFFVFTLFLIPFISFEYTPFLVMEYRTRIERNFFNELIKKVLISSLKFSLLIVIVYLIAGFVFTLKFSSDALISIVASFFRIYFFSIYTQLLFYFSYFLTSKFAFGILTFTFANFLFLSTFMTVHFGDFNSFHTQSIVDLIVSIISALLIISLFYQIKRKDYLQ